MRLTTIAGLAALSLFGSLTGAMACDPIAERCLPSRVVWPLTTENGMFIGVVEAPVRLPPLLEPSRFTGQPLTVRYNNPGSLPGSVDPYLRLVALPRVRRSHTVGAYPVGY